MTAIKGFSEENRWLSNFWTAPIVYDNHRFRSTEAAYQAAKCANRTDMAQFEDISAGAAKRLGRKIEMRSDWNDVKIQIMEDISYLKYTQNPHLGQKLLDTGNTHLEETNYWGDTFWGVCKGVGENHLGMVLMRLRDILREERY